MHLFIYLCIFEIGSLKLSLASELLYNLCRPQVYVNLHVSPVLGLQMGDTTPAPE